MTEPARGPDVIILMTDQERAAPSYEGAEVQAWRSDALECERWFKANAVEFRRHYTGSLACVPSRPTLFTGQYPDVHGVTQTDGLGKGSEDSRMRWLRAGEVPTLGNWFRAAGYDTHYDGKWHISHADLHTEDGLPLATNDAHGNIDADAVRAYLDADPLEPYGFSGWVGPEPHGSAMANTGLRRDPLIADRVVAWLEDRYARRAAGDPDALRPFLLVASFVNPHDICLYAAWALASPLESTEHEPPPIPAPPTAGEDLLDKPDAHREYRDRLFSGFGLNPVLSSIYRATASTYRRMYYRLHLEVDGPLERVRKAVVAGSDDAVLVRTADHGELLGSHGGLHQKWFTLYDEATRVPFSIARTGARTTEARTIDTPTSHVDIVPTLLAAAGIDEAAVAATLAKTFSEVHPLPGRNLLPVVDGAEPDRNRAVYLMTRDNVLEGDGLATAASRLLRLGMRTPPLLRTAVPADVGANFEGIVVTVAESAATGGAGHLWKLVRTFDDPATWTDPGTRHLTSSGLRGRAHRHTPLDDQWELYDLTDDPTESSNRWNDASVAAVRDHLHLVLDQQRRDAVPVRNEPWPYATWHPPATFPWPGDVAARLVRVGRRATR